MKDQTAEVLRALTEFNQLTQHRIPSWFTDWLRQITTEAIRQGGRIEVRGNEHVPFEILDDVYLHNFIICGPLWNSFNALLSKHAGRILEHQCGCGCCAPAVNFTYPIPPSHTLTPHIDLFLEKVRQGEEATFCA